jgi:hypothetical protein
MRALENALNWLLASSQDPAEVSLTVKGLLISAIPTMMFLSGIAQINLGSEMLTSVVDSFVAFLQAALVVVGTATTLYGALRKVWNTVLRPQQ